MLHLLQELYLLHEMVIISTKWNFHGHSLKHLVWLQNYLGSLVVYQAIRVLIWKSPNLCVEIFKSEILETTHLTDAQGQLNKHNTLKQDVKYIRRETSNGMKMLQCLAESTLTCNTKVSRIFSLNNILHMKIMADLCSHVNLSFRNLTRLYLVCSTATESADIPCLETLHKACKTMGSQIISCNT